jgi:hypothetical protein
MALAVITVNNLATPLDKKFQEVRLSPELWIWQSRRSARPAGP